MTKPVNIGPRAANDPWGAPRMNANGLTWPAWWRAVGVPASALTGDVANAMLKAWRAGEDPSDWRVAMNDAVITRVVMRNADGLTWSEWWRGTGLAVAHINVDTVHDVTAAFKRGDAPADYARAAIERDEYRRMRYAQPGVCDEPDAPCPQRAWSDTSAEAK